MESVTSTATLSGMKTGTRAGLKLRCGVMNLETAFDLFGFVVKYIVSLMSLRLRKSLGRFK